MNLSICLFIIVCFLTVFLILFYITFKEYDIQKIIINDVDKQEDLNLGIKPVLKKLLKQ